MSVKLYILRHGDAVMQAPRDSLRRLSELGHHQAKMAGERLIGENVSTVIASPYVRAQQTAEIVSQVLNCKHGIITSHSMTPDDEPSAALNFLNNYSNESGVLMVSHQPLVGTLIGYLTQGNFSAPVPMGTGSLVCLSMEVVGIGQAELEWTYHPT